MRPHDLYDHASVVSDLASMLRMAVDPDEPRPGLVLDRMRRLDDAFKVLRQAVAAWIVQSGYTPEADVEPGDAPGE